MAEYSRRLGIGIVGAGFMCKSHSNAFSTMKYMYPGEGYVPDLVAVGATTADRAAAAAVRYGYRKSCAGWADIVSDPEVDIVDICLSDALHTRVCLDAIGAGKHVICEKPLALNPEDALEMYLAAEKAKVRHMTGFNYRFVPAVRFAHELIASGAIGTPYRFSGSYSQDPGAAPSTPAEKVWYATGPKSSGVAKGIGSHLIDMARFLMGEIVSVDGRLTTYNRSRPSASGLLAVSQDEAMSALVDFEGGADGILSASAVAAGRKNRIFWEINGTGGSLWFDMEDINFLNVCLIESPDAPDAPMSPVAGFTRVDVTQADRRHPFADHWWPRGHGIGWEHAHVNELAHFLSCVASGAPVEPLGASFRDGYRAAAVIEAVARSSASGRRVDMEYADTMESREESR